LRAGWIRHTIDPISSSNRGFAWPSEPQYLSRRFSYALSRRYFARVEPAFGLSGVSDPFVLRIGVMYSIDSVARLAPAF
jgi:hypothetical protein